jgi:hypothetical protein
MLTNLRSQSLLEISNLETVWAKIRAEKQSTIDDFESLRVE